MKLHEAKQARSEVLRQSRANGDQVEQIMHEVDVVESEVQKIIKRFSRRLERYRADLAKRANAAAAEAEVGDGSPTGPDTGDGEEGGK